MATRNAETSVRITRDDERARRICSLALEFMSASAPVTSEQVARAHYPDLSAESFRRAFSRDREMLASCGVSVRGVRSSSGETLWEADPERSFARGAELEPRDAAALEVACRPLADDPSFPLAGELRLALAKLSRAFSEGLALGSWEGGSRARCLDALRRCMTERTAARVSYADARGAASERTIAPYAFFGLRGRLYLVAGRLDERGDEVPGGTRTYRVDRFDRVEPLRGVTYDVPEDFSVLDWRRLPFQMGPERLVGVFEVSPDREGDVRRAAGGQGSFEERDGSTLWSVPVSDVRAAAAWAVAAGIVPREPAPLVSAWRTTLEGVASHAG